MKNKKKHIVSFLAEGLATVAFPNVCVCCGLETTPGDRQLCSFCKRERFMDANPTNAPVSSDVILPEGISAQQALWQFDKGGALQELLHYLKYERLTGIGIELGRLMAARMLKHPMLAAKLKQKESLLVPVPLHYLKFRKRGFNQAFMIARGIQQVLSVPVCTPDAVVRQKNTRSQTGFTVSKRISNIKDAFRLKRPGEFTGRGLVIVDDVFTTGSTTFELASTLMEADPRDIIIATAAQA